MKNIGGNVKKLFLITLSLLFLTGCASTGVQLKKDVSTEIAIDISASTIGYLVGQNNIEKIPEWNRWLDTVLEIGEGDSVVSFEKLLAKGFDLVIDEPFLKMQLEKLIRLIEFPELQPPELPFLKGEYVELVKIILGGFRDGLQAAKAQAEK